MKSNKVISILNRDDFPEKGVFILLYRAEQIPPHLMLIVNGTYFSLSATGNKINEPTANLLRKIQSDQIKVLLFGVEIPETLNVNNLAVSSFLNYTEPESGKTTCLFPIRDFLNICLETKLKSNFVYELYNELRQLNKIGNVFGMNLEQELDADGCFVFKTYTRKEIDQCIESFTEKKSNAVSE